MSTTILDMSMSLDGFVAGPNESIDNGLGDGGQRLHDRLESGSNSADAEKMAAYESVGASVCGRRTPGPGADVVVQGAGTAQAAIAAGLVDGIQLHTVPLLLRRGRSLWTCPTVRPLDLDLVEVRQGTALHLRYLIARREDR